MLSSWSKYSIKLPMTWRQAGLISAAHHNIITPPDVLDTRGMGDETGGLGVNGDEGILLKRA